LHHARFSEIDLSTARVVCSVGPLDMQRRVQKQYAPATLINAYGITELCGTVALTELDDPLDVRLVSSGAPLEGFEMRIVDPESCAVLPPGEVGELVGRGRSMFDVYFRTKAATRAAVDAEGFFHTGDLAS